MKRNWERERNYWLDHMGQYHPGRRRRSKSGLITPRDYVAIPVPVNPSVPLNPPCLIWRWQLRGGGYGVLNGRGAHVVAFEQTRRRAVREGRQVNHLCNRPFCIQPAHLYEGTALQNSRDRQAELTLGRYRDWRELVHRLDQSLTPHHWPEPEPGPVSVGWGEPLECPHTDMPEMFEKRGTRGDVRFCANCQEVRVREEGREIRLWQRCRLGQPCRCGPELEEGAGRHDITLTSSLHDTPCNSMQPRVAGGGRDRAKSSLRDAPCN